jgi:hypothetical protein
MAGRDIAVRGFFEIENVQGVGWAFYYVGTLLGGLLEACSFEEGRDSAERGDVWAGRQKF